jgi:nucleoside 2-deoxyribosyltransferase
MKSTSRPKGFEPCNQAKKARKAFIAAPMSAFESDEDYKENRSSVLALADFLENKYGFSSIYYAGSNISTNKNFTSNEIAINKDLRALKKADTFIMVYPGKILSSVLIEAGYALALGKRMLLMVKDRRDLPYLFREAEQVSGTSLIPQLSICEYSSEDQLAEVCISALSELFSAA